MSTYYLGLVLSLNLSKLATEEETIFDELPLRYFHAKKKNNLEG